MKEPLIYAAASAAVYAAKSLTGRRIHYPIVGRGMLGFWHPDSERLKFEKPTHIGFAARHEAKVNQR